MKRLLIPLVGVLMLGFAVAHVVRARTPRDMLPPPEPPARSTFTEAVGAVGLVEASSENIAVSTPVPGLVVAVLVKAGDRVAAGQPLFTLDDRDLQAELGVRRAALAVARQRLARLQAQPRAEEIPPLEAKLREAEAALGDVLMQLRLIESVTDRRAIREEDLNRRRFAVEAARARRDEARTAVDLLKAEPGRPTSRPPARRSRPPRRRSRASRRTSHASPCGRPSLARCSSRTCGPGSMRRAGRSPRR